MEERGARVRRRRVNEPVRAVRAILMLGCAALAGLGAGNVAAQPRVTQGGAAPARPARGPALPATLVVGVLPNLAAVKLMAQYESLQRYLERLNGNRVQIVLPANLKAFFASTMQGEYDLAISAPNLARVAQLDGKLVPLAMYEPRINALLIAPRGTPVRTGSDLRGKVIALANPQSPVALYGRQWLKRLDLEPGRDYQIRPARTDMGVGRMVILGDAAAAIMGQGEFMSLPPEELAQLQIVDLFARVPNAFVLAHPRLGRANIARLKGQLKGFLADPQDGAAFRRATGLDAIVDADEAILRELDPYADPTRQAMGAARP